MLVPESISISGYRAFDNVTIPIADKVTCLVGRNNSGKSSIIEAFKLLATTVNLPDTGVRDAKDLDDESVPNFEKLSLKIVFNINSTSDAIKGLYSHVLSNGVAGEGNAFRQVFLKESVKITYEFKPLLYYKDLNLYQIKIDDLVLFQYTTPKENSMPIPWNISLKMRWLSSIAGDRGFVAFRETPMSELSTILKEFVYSIKAISADRHIPTQINSGSEIELSENLSETTKLLHNWNSSKRKKFSLIVKFLRSLDDSIGDIRFEPKKSGEMILKFADDNEADEGKTLLKNSGSGIKQLLGMATFILNDDNPKFILIDEPQAFLHPHAEEEFVDLMKATGHHFLIATHSPVFINSFSNGLVLLKKSLGKSVVVQSSQTKQKLFKLIAQELGSSAHQLMVGKGVIFLEGATEIAVLESIANHDESIQKKIKNYVIRALPATGMVIGSGKNVTRDLLQEIQVCTGLKTIIILDKDSKVRDDLNKRVVFCDYSMIEELFLDSVTLVEVVNKISKEKGYGVEAVNSIIEPILLEKDLTPSKKLNNIFWTAFKEEYDKVKHGRLIASHVMSNRPQLLSHFSNKVLEAIDLIESK